MFLGLGMTPATPKEAECSIFLCEPGLSNKTNLTLKSPELWHPAGKVNPARAAPAFRNWRNGSACEVFGGQ
jgi:hypothetical protein